ncbi:polyketide cyclase/dehydrase/lipid transport protein [Pacificibacter maritimus]|uniref:Polyketide cyclase/dehydrase/lipid transport protein n=1 Tax=Pacificibacter maritimus TaxID=762213 RepID=A0A3N4UDI8_9RHOB|nr:SRPBCC family protein [Pacificibacter maritimus]RPE66495.1 polyketide cyclase/dehydrase/lipid transport protein [Pacificibacter maritimus]
MKFSTRHDIEAPAAFVFEQFSDFDGLERQAMRRGVEVRRKTADQPRGVGAAWALRAPFRGKWREIDAHLTEFDEPNAIEAEAKSGGLDMTVSIDLVPLSPQRTRVSFGYEVRPQTISARIMVQSVKFAKASLQRRFEKRIGKFCSTIDAKFEEKQRA